MGTSADKKTHGLYDDHQICLSAGYYRWSSTAIGKTVKKLPA